MSGRSWKRKYVEKHGQAWRPNNVFENVAVNNDSYHILINSSEEIDFETDSAIKSIRELEIIYPEGTKRVVFHKQCTLLGKILDGEFILKENESEELMILWKKGLLFLTTPKVVDITKAIFNLGKPLTFSEEIVNKIKQLSDDSITIEDRLSASGIEFLHRADTIGFPDYNSSIVEWQKRKI
jgi:hypothetical protein